MKQILKSYMKTFFKNWVSTIGTILFIIMLATMIIGILATPLQLNSQIKKIENATTRYNSVLNKRLFTDDFIFNYILDPKDYNYDDGTQMIGKPKNIKEGETVVIKSTVKGQENVNLVEMKTGILSKLALESVKNYIEHLVELSPQYENFISTVEGQKKFVEEKVANFINRFLEFTTDNQLRNDISQVLVIPVENAGKNLEDSIWKYDQVKNFANSYLKSLKDFVIFEYEQIGIKLSNGNDFYRNLKTEIAKVLESKNEFQINKQKGNISKAASLMAFPITTEKRSESFLEWKNQIFNLIWTSVIEDETNVLNATKDIIDKFYKTIYDQENEVENPKAKIFFLNVPRPFYFTNEMKKNMAPFNNNFRQYLTASIIKNENNIHSKYGNNFKYATEVENRFSYTNKSSTSVNTKFSTDIYSNNLNAEMNELFMLKGNVPRKWNENDYLNNIDPEMVISEKYAKAHNLSVGDYLDYPIQFSSSKTDINDLTDPEKAFYNKPMRFRISGIGIKYDNITPGKEYKKLTQELEDYTYGYIDSNLAALLVDKLKFNTTPNAFSSLTRTRIKNNLGADSTPTKLFQKNQNNSDSSIFDLTQNSKVFTEYKDMKEYSTVNMIKIQILVFIILGTAVLVLAFVFINFLIKKEMNETRKQLGIFKSFGYRNTELSWIFATKTMIIIFVGIIIGYFCSIPLQIYSARASEKLVMFNYQHIYFSASFFFIIFILIPISFLLISYLITIYYIKEPALKLINQQFRVTRSITRNNVIIRKMNKSNTFFNYRMRRAFVKTAKGKFIMIQIIFAMSSFAYALMFGAQGILDQVIQQGFSNYNSQLNHKYSYENLSTFKIGTDEGKFVINDQIIDENKWNAQLNKYRDFSKYKSANEYLNNQKDQSDSRYGTKIIMDAISNDMTSYDQKGNWKGLDKLLPLSVAKMLMNNEETSNIDFLGIKDWFIADLALFKTAPKTTNEKYTQWVTGLKENKKLNLKTKDLEENYIKYSEILSAIKNPEELQKLLKQTLIGMVDKEDDLDKFNTLFMSDISKLLSMVYAMQYAQAQLNKIMQNEFPNDIESAWNKLSQDEVLKKFDPRNDKYWGVINNPLITSGNVGDGVQKRSIIEETSRSVGLNLENIPSGIKSLISTSILTKAVNNINEEKIVTLNQFLFNKKTDLLVNNIGVMNTDSSATSDLQLSMVDFKEGKYGDIRSAYKMEGVTDEQIKKTTEVNPDGSMNVIIPYALAKADGLSIGSNFKVKTLGRDSSTFKFKVVGINQSEKMPVDLKWNIFLDYRTFASQYFSKDLNERMFGTKNDLKENMIFNSMFSKEPMLQGKLDLKNIAASIKNMKFEGTDIATEMQHGTSFMFSIIKAFIGDKFPLIDKLGLIPSNNIYALKNPSISSGTTKYFGVPINIMKSTVQMISTMITTLLNLAIALLTILLIIILVVIMNIIVEESAKVILTLRAIGYKRGQINWMIMGSYIIGAFISFAISYILSVIVWQVLAIICAKLYQIYLTISFDPITLFSTFGIIAFIMAISWYASDKQVNRRQLSQITNIT